MPRQPGVRLWGQPSGLSHAGQAAGKKAGPIRALCKAPTVCCACQGRRRGEKGDVLLRDPPAIGEELTVRVSRPRRLLAACSRLWDGFSV